MSKQARVKQTDRILQYLSSGQRLNRLNCWDALGILEAPARISELRKAGHLIQTHMVDVTNRFGDNVKVAEWSM